MTLHVSNRFMEELFIGLRQKKSEQILLLLRAEAFQQAFWHQGYAGGFHVGDLVLLDGQSLTGNLAEHNFFGSILEENTIGGAAVS